MISYIYLLIYIPNKILLLNISNKCKLIMCYEDINNNVYFIFSLF